MKKTPQLDRSAEAQQVREELAHDDNALRALDAMADQSDEEVDIPPVPDDLRGKWVDRYGEPEAARAKPKENASVSFFERFSRLLAYGGGATALAAVAVLIAINFGNPEAPSGGGSDTVIMRGVEDFVPKADTTIVFIANADIPFSEFAETRNVGKVLQAGDLESAQKVIDEEKLESAVILHAATGKIQTWSGALSDEISLEDISGTFDALDLSEAIDGFLNP